MQTTPWKGNNCRDPCCSSSTTSFIIGSLGQIWRNWRTVKQNHNTPKFLWQIAARAVSYTGKGSRGVPPI